MHATRHGDQLQLLQQLAATVAVSTDVMAVMLDADGTCWGAAAHHKMQVLLSPSIARAKVLQKLAVWLTGKALHIRSKDCAANGGCWSILVSSWNQMPAEHPGTLLP